MSVLLAASLPAQVVQATLPAVCTHLPGNAALSMPLRWTQGLMQVQIDHDLLPANLTEGRVITALRLRRPAMLDEPAYGAITRTLTVRAAFTTQTVGYLVQNLAQNRIAINAPATGTGIVDVFGPATVNIAPTAAFGPGDRLGPEFLTLPLTTPITVPPAATLLNPGLFLEFEVSDPVFGADAGNWVDAIWIDNSGPVGYAAPLGNRGCDARGNLTLYWDGAAPPRRGVNAALRVERALPGTLVVAMYGFDPVTHGINQLFGNGFYLGLGTSLGSIGMPGCYQWTPMDFTTYGVSNAIGAWSFNFALPPAYLTSGMMLSVQAAELSPTANPTGILTTNGEALVLDDAGIHNHCVTLMFLGTPTATSVAPWAPFHGMMPVIGIDY